ncbi:MAG: AAA family ATPase [Desulfovibrio sp.]|nr:AAA family ATPase [Desulfovibrio sp.]
MGINKFRDRIVEIYDEAHSLKTKNDDGIKGKHLDTILDAINYIYQFVMNDENLILIRQTYDEHTIKNSPLDSLSCEIARKINEFDDILNSDLFGFMHVDKISNNNSVNNISILASKLNDQEFLKLLSAYDVLKHLYGHNKTLIILGANGSGKTSFANYLKNLERHIKVIPASKPIKSVGQMFQNFNSTLEKYNKDLYSGGDLKEDIIQKLIVGLCIDHDNAARKYRDTGERGGKTTYEKIKEIFDDFFEVKLNNSCFASKEMCASKNGCPPFTFNAMSDGERAAFFYIATVIAAPDKSFIIVDEPENHLNPAIYNKIWDKLIGTRKDCQFIFISHTIDFIRARSNYELVKIKDFSHPNIFEFEFLGTSLEDIKSEHIIEIVGSRKPILFCEGVKDNYDYKIYEILFGEKYTVISTGNCESVKSSVVACNIHATTYSIQSAIGIIDSDLKSDREIESLKHKNIYTLRCNEIEMLLLDEYIFKAVLHHQFMNENEFENFKSDFMSKINSRKDYIVKRLVKTQIDEKLVISKIDDKSHKTKEEFKTNLSNIFLNIDVDTLWRESENRVSKAIAEVDYDVALRLCCLEHQEVIGGIVNKIIPNYDTIALGLLSSSKELAGRIRDTYFPEVPMNV